MKLSVIFIAFLSFNILKSKGDLMKCRPKTTVAPLTSKPTTQAPTTTTITTTTTPEPISFSYLPDEDMFHQFLIDQEIELQPSSNFSERLEIFMDNYRKMRDHNERYHQGLESYEAGLNQFSHLNDTEFGDIFGNFQLKTKNSTYFPEFYYYPTQDEIKNLPISFNWLDRYAVFPVQDQGLCNSCYVFSALASIEAQMIIRKQTRVKLSEQEAMECSERCANPGWMYKVFELSTRFHGFAAASFYPYKKRDVDSICEAHGNRVNHSEAKNYFYAEGEQDMMAALVNRGPLAGSFDMYPSVKFYTSGIYKGRNGNEASLGGHAILIVGYGQNSLGEKYWIIRNSWGKGFGESGNIRMLRGANTCDIENSGGLVPTMI